MMELIDHQFSVPNKIMDLDNDHQQVAVKNI